MCRQTESRPGRRPNKTNTGEREKEKTSTKNKKEVLGKETEPKGITKQWQRQNQRVQNHGKQHQQALKEKNIKAKQPQVETNHEAKNKWGTGAKGKINRPDSSKQEKEEITSIKNKPIMPIMAA